MQFADFVALNIHDLKNRLAMVAARAERHGDGETVRDILAVAGALASLLACYKAEAGQLSAVEEACSPAYLLDELTADSRKLAQPHLRVETADAPASWYYDEELVRMVLANALQNALRYARETVVVSAVQDGEWLELRVHDDGPGYPDGVRLAPEAAAPVSRDGSGVGLYLARAVAALHRNKGLAGEVRLENDHGALFRLRLPQ